MLRGLPLRHLLLAMAALLLIVGGPGGPLCADALAAQRAPQTAHDTTMHAMSGCDMPSPPSKKNARLAPDCIALCLVIDVAGPAMADRLPAKSAIRAPIIRELDGVQVLPDAEPPRCV